MVEKEDLKAEMLVCKSFFHRFKKKYVVLDGTQLKFSKYENKVDRNIIDLTKAVVADSKDRRFKILYEDKKVYFQPQTVELKAKWMIALKENAQIQVQEPRKKQEEEILTKGHMTLAQIEAFLFDKDSRFHKQIEQTVSSFSSLQLVLKNLEQGLKPLKRPEVDQALSQADLFEMQLWQMLKSVDKMRRDVHTIIEEVALKEIEQDPVGFMRKEARQGEAVGEMPVDSMSQQDDLWLNMSGEEENKQEEEFNLEVKEEEVDSAVQVSQNYDQIRPKLLSNRDSREENPDDKQQYLSKSVQPKKFIDDTVLHHEDSFGTNEDLIGNIYKDAYQPNQEVNQSMKIKLEEEEKKIEEEDDEEPLHREVLPAFKDPKVKPSIWSIIKDSIGKDFTKISVPVYFNDPTNFLHRSCLTMEYNNQFMNKACEEPDSLKRLCYITGHMMASYCSAEKMATKPFNPILNETFEYFTPDYQFVSEQVSHHPPVSAYHCKGKAGYTIDGDSATKSKLSGKTLIFQMTGCTRYFLEKWNESFESTKPAFSGHNLIIGQMYVDIGGKVTVKNLTTGSIAKVEFHRRGWTATSYFKCEGTIYDPAGKEKYKIHGDWSKEFFLENLETKEKEKIWEKKPYHEKVDFMYGMTPMAIDLNYFPKRLQKVVPPTDSRWRPDQRHVEHGEMKQANEEKLRLEDKQRELRAFRKKHQIEHQPVYFEEIKDQPGQKEQRWTFNGKYFQDREKQDWSALPDIYSEKPYTDDCIR